MQPLLEIKNMTCRYRGVTAVEDVTMNVFSGEVICILGANGAGKSTAMRAIAGGHRLARGSVSIRGERVDGETFLPAVAAGIAFVPEGRRIFLNQSVADNLEIGAYRLRKQGRSTADRMARVYEIFPMLAERPKALASSLSGGQQQMLAIGQALMAEPDLLILDEPSLGLAPVVVDTVMDAIRTLKATGQTIMLVEQMVKKAVDVSDRGYVLQNGRIAFEGTAEELLGSQAVRAAYLGTNASDQD